MKNISFQTDRRLWLLIGFTFFVASWFFPLIAIKSDSMSPAVWLWGIISSLFYPGSFDSREFFGVITVLVIFSFFSAVLSLVAAWLIQCIIVIIRTMKIEMAHRKT
jgi:hypothetical protein